MTDTASTAKKYVILEKQIRSQRDENNRWGRDNSYFFLTLRLIGVACGAVAFVAATLPPIFFGIPIEKWHTTVPIAISGAAFIAINQLKLTERTNLHYRKSSLLNILYLKLTCECSDPITDKEIKEVCEEFKKLTELTEKEFAEMTLSLGKSEHIGHA